MSDVEAADDVAGLLMVVATTHECTHNYTAASRHPAADADVVDAVQSRNRARDSIERVGVDLTRIE